MSDKRFIFSLLITVLLLLMIAPACAQASGKIKVVCTTSVLMDPVTFIGGHNVEAVSIADPALCPNLQSDIIPSRIQLNANFIKNADLFVAYNDTNDQEYNIPAVANYMSANGYGNVTWQCITNSEGWNTPDEAKGVAGQVKGWLEAKDPANKSYYEQNYGKYCSLLDAVTPAAAEKAQLNNTGAIVMMWQMDPVQNWLDMNVVDFYAPEFVMGGSKTPDKIVDAINANPDKYRNVSYIIENMQSGELAKGIEEALKDHGINAKRVIFTNFPDSAPNTTTMADVLNYNKQLVLGQSASPTPAAAGTATAVPTASPAATPSPIGMEVLVGGLLMGAVIAVMGKKA